MKRRSLETVPGNPACCRGRTAVHEEKEERAPFAVAAWARAAPRRPCSGESPGGVRGAGTSPRAVRALRGRGRALPGRPRGGEARRELGIGPARAEAGPRRWRRVGTRGGGVAGRGAAARKAAGGGRAARGSWAGSGLGAGPAARRGRAAGRPGVGPARGGRRGRGMPHCCCSRDAPLFSGRAGTARGRGCGGSFSAVEGCCGGAAEGLRGTPVAVAALCKTWRGAAAGRRSPERCCWDVASLNGLLREVFSKTCLVLFKYVIITFIL